MTNIAFQQGVGEGRSAGEPLHRDRGSLRRPASPHEFCQRLLAVYVLIPAVVSKAGPSREADRDCYTGACCEVLMKRNWRAAGPRKDLLVHKHWVVNAERIVHPGKRPVAPGVQGYLTHILQFLCCRCC